MKRLNILALTICALCAANTMLSAQTFNVLASFNGFDGANPGATLVQGPNGNYYGTTATGGTISTTSPGSGVIYEVTPTGKIILLHIFCLEARCPDGSGPQAPLVLATDGNFYGTTVDGGTHSVGTIFKITPEGKFTSIYSFCAETVLGICTDGMLVTAGLIQAVNGDFYGMAQAGGSHNEGTVFRVTSAGKLTVLYNFCSQDPPYCADGASPWATLIQGNDGYLYGTAEEGGTYRGGTVFKLALDGTLTTIYNFCPSETGVTCPDGSAPESALIQASNGNFYGATTTGGTVNCGITKVGCGTVFELTPAGVLTTLHSFCSLANCADGAYPSGVTQGTDGNFYGITSGSGANKWGTLFQITSAGVLNTLYNFCAQSKCDDGSSPKVAPFQATNGTFYGTTFIGGTGEACPYTQCGTVFTLSMGLGPFVQTMPVAGLIGGAINILGNNLTGTTGVSFNGVPARFTVLSDTEIAVHVPAGAKTGPVQVVTPGGTLTSNVAFQVEP
jgi:uncharacterized repeat protein (TIGR03803 family)